MKRHYDGNHGTENRSMQSLRIDGGAGSPTATGWRNPAAFPVPITWAAHGVRWGWL